MANLSPFPPGHVIDDRYVITQVLGQGGFGRTYQAQDRKRFGEPCVLKEFVPKASIQQDPTTFAKAQELFNREAQVLYGLNHPQIPRFRELSVPSVQGQGRLLLVQDWIQGETYGQLLQGQGQGLGEKVVIQWLKDLLPVLDYLHSQKPPLIHRDISPDNVMLCRHTSKPILIDFGAVKQWVSGSVQSPGTVIGKTGFAPPEQQQGHPCPASDLYALGITAVVLLTGQQPKSVPWQPGQWQGLSPTGVSPGLGAVIDGLIQPRPSDRYATVAAVQADLQPLLAASTALENPAPQPPSPPQTVVAFPKPPAARVTETSPPPRPPQPPTASQGTADSFIDDLNNHRHQGDWVYGLWQLLKNSGLQRFARGIGLSVLGLTVVLASGSYGWQLMRQGRSTTPTTPADPGDSVCDTAAIWDRYDALDAVQTLPDLAPAIDDLFYAEVPKKVVKGERQPILADETNHQRHWCELADQWLSDRGG